MARLRTPGRWFHYKRAIITVMAVIMVMGMLLYQADKFTHDSWQHWPDWQRMLDYRNLATSVGQGTKPSGRILVTGGSGVVGQHVVRRLLASRVSVTVLDIDPFFASRPSSLTSSIDRTDLLHVVQADIRNDTALGQAFTDDVLGIIHLAGVVSSDRCLANEEDCWDINFRGTEVLLNVVEKQRSATQQYPWVLYASTAEASGLLLPTHEGDVFGLSKVAAEEAIERRILELQSKDTTSSLHAISLRLGEVYGDEDDWEESLVPYMMTRALTNLPILVGNLNQRLSLVHIEDVVEAIFLAVSRLNKKLLSDRSGFWPLLPARLDIFDISPTSSTSVSQVVQTILKITCSPSALTNLGATPTPISSMDDVGVRTLPGWRPKVSLDEGLRALAVARLVRTAHYLSGKLQEGRCTGMMLYSQRDLLLLNGCAGIIGVRMAEEISYLNRHNSLFDGTVAPAEYKFLVEEEQGHTICSFKNQSGYLYTLPLPAGEIETQFKARIDPSTGYISLASLSTGRALTQPRTSGEQAYLSDQEATFIWRLSPQCCPGLRQRWPFFTDSPLSSAINDRYREIEILFNASTPQTLCKAFQEAKTEALIKLERLADRSRLTFLGETPLPDSPPEQWRVAKLPPCENLCDHPTICVDTGSCACVEASCLPRRCSVLDAFAYRSRISYPLPETTAASFTSDEVLTKNVEGLSWLRTLRPNIRRYFAYNPDFPGINVTRLPEDFQKYRDGHPERFDNLLPKRPGCLTSDSAMERGLKLLSEPIGNDSLVFLPYYQASAWYPPLAEWYDHAMTSSIPLDFDHSRLIVPFSHDFGICNFFTYSVFDARARIANQGARPHTAIKEGTAWSVMGDLNVPCYRPHQDVVIPTRTCWQDVLRSRFGNVRNVRPIRQRSNLVFFGGTYVGTGADARRKVSCSRRYDLPSVPELPDRLVGGRSMPTLFNVYEQEKDYLDTLGNTVFCPHPRGTAGWAPRLIDGLYSGCIPVLIGSKTHHPFFPLFDYTKFSITISESDLDRMEDVLLTYTWQELESLQANLMLVRDAFLYPGDDDMEYHLKYRGPMFYALHSTRLMGLTKWPARTICNSRELEDGHD